MSTTFKTIDGTTAPQRVVFHPSHKAASIYELLLVGDDGIARTSPEPLVGPSRYREYPVSECYADYDTANPERITP